jgi:hypothetical protein
MEFVGVSHEIYSPCSFSTLNSVYKSRYLQISRAGGVLPHNLLCSDEVSSTLRMEFGTLVQLHNPFLRCTFNTSIPVRSCPALYEEKKIASSATSSKTCLVIEHLMDEPPKSKTAFAGKQLNSKFMHTIPINQISHFLASTQLSSHIQNINTSDLPVYTAQAPRPLTLIRRLYHPPKTR